MEHEYFVYMLTNKSRSTLYVGMTGDLQRRMGEHKEGNVDGFTKRYRLTRLVWVELFGRPLEAIAAEKRIKKWNRAWKERLI